MVDEIAVLRAFCAGVERIRVGTKLVSFLFRERQQRVFIHYAPQLCCATQHVSKHAWAIDELDVCGFGRDHPVRHCTGDLESAVSFVTELQEQCLALASFPERGAIPKDYVLKALGYRYLVYQHYLVFYLMDASEQSVYIHAFFNEKQDYFRYMRKRI